MSEFGSMKAITLAEQKYLFTYMKGLVLAVRFLILDTS